MRHDLWEKPTRLLRIESLPYKLLGVSEDSAKGSDTTMLRGPVDVVCWSFLESFNKFFNQKILKKSYWTSKLGREGRSSHRCVWLKARKQREADTDQPSWWRAPQGLILLMSENSGSRLGPQLKCERR